MKLTAEQIAHRQVAGKTKSGDPIVYVLTTGGLHSLFSKSGDTVETLGAAPHRAIAMWLAEKKSDGLRWDDDFKDGKLTKSADARFQELRNIFFSPTIPGQLSKSEPQYLVYDPKGKSFSLYGEQALKKAWSEGRHRDDLIRPVDMSEPVAYGRYHRLYG